MTVHTHTHTLQYTPHPWDMEHILSLPRCSPDQSLSRIELELVEVGRHVGKSCQTIGVQVLVLWGGEGRGGEGRGREGGEGKREGREGKEGGEGRERGRGGEGMKRGSVSRINHT